MSGYGEILGLAPDTEAILGVILSGSRGRETARPESDWDCYVIVTDGARDAVTSTLDRCVDGTVDLTILTRSEFENHAAPGSTTAWEAYAFVHARIDYDGLDGWIARIADAKEILPPKVAEDTARESLDAYVNGSVRAAKSLRDGQEEAASLDRSESVGPALATLFATESRIRPYNRYLAWELERHPLELSSPLGRSIPRLAANVTSGDPQASASLFALIESRARSAGLSEVVDAWNEGALALARGRYLIPIGARPRSPR